MERKILFIGGSPRGLEVIRMLIGRGKGVTVVYAVILKEDDHEDVKVADEIQHLCKTNKIPFVTSRNFPPKLADTILAHQPDVAFVCGWRSIFPEEFFTKIPMGCLVAHDALLPQYRGFTPTTWAMINGEKKTGVTLFKVERGPVDSGGICGQKEVNIDQNETMSDIYPKVIRATVDLFREFLEAWQSDTVSFVAQDESQATYTCKRVPDDGRVDWTKPAREVFDLIRAQMPPNPYSWTIFRSKKLFIKRASFPRREMTFVGRVPGRICHVSKEGVLVLCGDGQVALHEVMDEKKKIFRADEILKSVKMTLGRE